VGAHKFDYFWRYIIWRVDSECGTVDYGLQRDLLPGGSGGIFGGVKEHGVGAVEKSLRGGFEVGGCGIEDGEIEIGLDEAQDAVGFDDDVFGRR